jgi:hypothetical protein
LLILNGEKKIMGKERYDLQVRRYVGSLATGSGFIVGYMGSLESNARADFILDFFDKEWDIKYIP